MHYKQDKVVIGSQVLSVALETCHRRVRKMERNLAERLPLLKDVFISIDHPISAEALAILSETSTEPLVTALITTALSTGRTMIKVFAFFIMLCCNRLALNAGLAMPLMHFEFCPRKLFFVAVFDPFLSASVASYGPSHLGPSFSVSSA
ncbi:hypothetical protein Tco_0148691 [Tanacetum coccineum]